jgi:hypothetical protein
MAINTTTSNYVNISELPQTQEALNGDLLILQTENGTQTIDFENFNVVKTDAAGNATVVGNLTGNNAELGVLSADAIDSISYAVNGKPGFTAVQGFYNYLTINSGLVTSAIQTSPSPEYNSLITYMANLTSWLNTIYKKIIDYTGTTTVNGGTTYSVVNIPNFYVNYAPGLGSTDLQTQHVQIFCTNTELYNTTTNRISGLPFASSSTNSAITTLTKDGSNLSFRLNAGHNLFQNTTYIYRILYTYS